MESITKKNTQYNTPTVSFTTTNHIARKALGLNLNEYAIADIIYHLSNNPEHEWCSMSKAHIAEIFDLTEQGVHKILRKLEKDGLILKHGGTKFLKTSQKWYDTVIIGQNTKQSLATSSNSSSDTKQSLVGGETKFSPDTKQSLVNNNIYNNNINIYNSSYEELPKEVPEDEMVGLCFEERKEEILVPEVLPEPKPVPKEYGNPDINRLMKEGLEILNLPHFDDTIKNNRKFAAICLRKFGTVDNVLDILKASKASNFWNGKITKFETLLDHGMLIMAQQREKSNERGRLGFRV